jgi:hypothetical protein
MALGLMNGVAFGAGSALVTAVGFGVARIGAANALLDVSALTLLCAATYWLAGRRLDERAKVYSPGAPRTAA